MLDFRSAFRAINEIIGKNRDFVDEDIRYPQISGHNIVEIWNNRK